MGRTVYINPPYSGTAKFVEKAHRSWREGDCEVVLLLLQTQTHHRWFHNEVVGHADVFFLNGRIAFHRPGHKLGPAPFGNMFVAYGFDEPKVERMLTTFDCVHLPRTARVGNASRSNSGSTMSSHEALAHDATVSFLGDALAALGAVQNPNRSRTTLRTNPINIQRPPESLGQCGPYFARIWSRISARTWDWYGSRIARR